MSNLEHLEQVLRRIGEALEGVVRAQYWSTTDEEFEAIRAISEHLWKARNATKQAIRMEADAHHAAGPRSGSPVTGAAEREDR
jgi:hypothetical protein